jgi:hypothetical protein
MKTLLIATSAIALVAGAAFADDDDKKGPVTKAAEIPAALNGQLNLGEVNAKLNVVAEESAATSGTAAAIGNSISGNLAALDLGNFDVAAGQVNTGAITAELTADTEKATGDVAMTAAAIGNSVSFTMESLSAISAPVTQKNDARVSASAEVAVKSAAAATEATAAAIGNSISVTQSLTQ